MSSHVEAHQTVKSEGRWDVLLLRSLHGARAFIASSRPVLPMNGCGDRDPVAGDVNVFEGEHPSSSRSNEIVLIS